MRLHRGTVVGELEARGLAGAAIHADVELLEVVLRSLHGAHPALAAFSAHDARKSDRRQIGIEYEVSC